jgi:hypothetical protein
LLLLFGEEKENPLDEEKENPLGRGKHPLGKEKREE